MSEQALQSKILRYLKKHGYKSIKTIMVSVKGTSDILACSPTGLYVAIEVKAPGKMNTVSPLQKHFIKEINKRGGLAFATDNYKEFIKRINNGKV